MLFEYESSLLGKTVSTCFYKGFEKRVKFMVFIIRSLNETPHGYCAQVELQARPKLASSNGYSFKIKIKSLIERTRRSILRTSRTTIQAKTSIYMSSLRVLPPCLAASFESFSKRPKCYHFCVGNEDRVLFTNSFASSVVCLLFKLFCYEDFQNLLLGWVAKRLMSSYKHCKILSFKAAPNTCYLRYRTQNRLRA